MASTIELNFFNFNQKKLVNRFKLSYKNDIENIDQDVIERDIPETVFINGKDKAEISIVLFDITSKNKEYKFHVYYGKNRVYVQVKVLFNKTYEIILINAVDLRIIQEDFVFNKLDSFDTKNRKRLTLINYEPSYISITDFTFYLTDIISDNCNIKSETYQLTITDIPNQKVIVKPMEKKINNSFKLLIDLKNELSNFSKELEKMLEMKDQQLYKKEYGLIKNKFNYLSNTKCNINLNKSNLYLERIFKSNIITDLDLFWNFFLSQYFLEHKIKIKNNQILFSSFYSKIKNIKNNLINKKLEFYEKIKILKTLFFSFNNCNDIESLNSLNLRYFIISEREGNSIMDKVSKFFDNFINTLSEESLIFPYLLNIDSGCGYYNKEKIYTIDLINLDMVKNHLKDLFPKSCVFYYLKGNKNQAFTSLCGGVGINEYYLLKNIKNRNINYNTADNKINNINENELDDIAILISLYLMHEYMGHSKFNLSEKYENSPKKILNKENKLIELKYYEEYNSDDSDSEFILSSNSQYRGDSGHFIEMAFGKFGKFYIAIILTQLKNVGKLIGRAELFTDKNGLILRNYTILKYIAEKNKITFNFDKNFTIEQEINEMQKKINIEQYEKEMEKKKEKEEEKMIKKETLFGKRERNDEGSDEEGNEEINRVTKKQKLETNIKLITEKEKEEGIIKNESETESEENKIFKNEQQLKRNDKSEENMDEDELFEIVEKRLIKKFNFNSNENVIEKVYDLINDDKIDEKDKDDLLLFLSRLEIKY